MRFDVVLKGARLATNPGELVDIGITNGKIAAIAPDLAEAVASEAIGGALVVPGLVETHIHLDKSCIIDRCTIREGSLKEAIAETARAKRAFTEADIFERACATLGLNAFTPFGDASLIRMANLYANVAQLGRREDFERCFDMITGAAARLMNLDGYGLSVGDGADLLVLPCQSVAAAVTELTQPLTGFKRGRRSFTRPPTRLHRPYSA